jgi:hypothetical protein
MRQAVTSNSAVPTRHRSPSTTLVRCSPLVRRSSPNDAAPVRAPARQRQQAGAGDADGLDPARGHFFEAVDSLVESAATKASWGTSTRPTIFIRFLPSFCFSSSFRLRVMSPP